MAYFLKLMSIIFATLLYVEMIDIHAQDYLIGFASSDKSETISSIKVENLTQGTSLSVKGSDLLHLMGIVDGIEPTPGYSEDGLIFYPNPMTDYAKMHFVLTESGNTIISLYDLSSREIIHSENFLSKGQHSYRIEGLYSGMYIVTLQSGRYSISGRLICTGSQKRNPQIIYENTSIAQQKNGTLKITEDDSISKGTGSETVMQYTAGDRLKYTAVSGNNSTVVVDMPNKSDTIIFIFLDCIDADDNNYPIVIIGEQFWMAENLKTTKFSDSTSIPLVTNASEWNALTTPGYCFYNNDETENKNVYGGMYNWYAVNDSKNICPVGWHVPTDIEWKTLEMYLGMTKIASDSVGWRGISEGGKLKEVGISHWLNPNKGAIDESGFTGRPGGYRDPNDGLYSDKGWYGIWWSASEVDTAKAWTRHLGYTYSKINRNDIEKNYGISVRCLKNPIISIEAFPGIYGELQYFIINEDTMIVELINNKYVFQRDIILTEDQLKSKAPKGAGFTYEYVKEIDDWIVKRWNYDTIYYSIHKNAEYKKSDIEKAIKDYTDNTCLKFKLRKNEPNYVEFIRSTDDGNSSNVGMWCGRQEIEISDKAVPYVIKHEIGHTIGLFHEHCRKDRDDHIKVSWDLIDLVDRPQFEKLPFNVTYQNNYDLKSIMHYASEEKYKYNLLTHSYIFGYTINKNSDNTLILINEELSRGDTAIINKMYKYDRIRDKDGNIYMTIKIGDQEWMAENLKTTKYNDGTDIPIEKSGSEWANLSTPAYCWYKNDIDNKEVYGALYNWYAVATGILCPSGWHVPTDYEWTTLIYLLDKAELKSNAGGKLKEACTNHWNEPNTGATNLTGFTARPGGYRYGLGIFRYMGESGCWWSSSESKPTYALIRRMGYDYSDVKKEQVYYKGFGFSVRCLKNSP